MRANIVGNPSEHAFVRKEPGAAEKAFKALKSDPGTPGRVFEMLTSAEVEWPRAALPAVAKKLGMPKGAFVEWFTTEHAGVYEAALRVVAADLAVTAMQAALDAKPEDVQAQKLVADTALKIASRFDRARYGDQTVNVKAGVLIADSGLLGEASDLLERLARPAQKVVSEQ